MSQKDWPGSVVSKTPVAPAGNNANSAASGIWSMNDVAYWVKQSNWPDPSRVVDPYFYDVTLLLTGNGTNGAQNNTFLDSSANNFTITRNGNTTQGTFSPYGSLWSTYTEPGATRAALEFSFSGSPFETAVTGTNYTIEAWVNRSYDSGNQYQCVCSSSGDRNNIFTINSTDTCEFRSNGGTTLFSLTASTFFPIGVWVHFALVCQGTTWTLYKNGVSQGTSTGSKTTNGGTMDVLGRGDMNNFGYISNFRVSNSARYTTNFTPSTTPFSSDANTVMLLSSTNYGIKDISANNQQFTQLGTITTTRFSPFNPTAPYSAATIGGSGYFDGSGDYLSAASGSSATAFGTGDFTIEGWFFATTTTTGWQPFAGVGTNIDGQLIRLNQSVNNSGQYGFIYPNSTNNGSIYVYSGSAFPTNKWVHLALVRNGTNLTLYANGTQVAQATGVGFNFTNTSGALIGYGAYSSDGYYTGYIGGFRIVKGTAVYTTAFTPPTSPLTAITNTSLLCNFTNAGIPDAAMMNDLETVGNAQVSTSVVKYGTGSLAFDGSGDWLTLLRTPQMTFGSGDFTIEAWVYTASSSYGGIFSTRGNSGIYDGLSLQVKAAGSSAVQLLLTTNGSTWQILTQGGAISSNTWTHIAWVRSGTSFVLYINGTSAITNTVSGSVYQNTTNVYVGTDADGSYNGYIDDLRITKGYARYTANFTPPAAAFPTF